MVEEAEVDHSARFFKMVTWRNIDIVDPEHQVLTSVESHGHMPQGRTHDGDD